MKLELAQRWEDVQRAASAVKTCIAVPGWANHDNAKEDWEQNPGLVEYWVNETRNQYSRVILVAESYSQKVLWLLDYAKPFNSDHVQRLSAVLFGMLMVAYPPTDLTSVTPILLPALQRPTWLKYMTRPLYATEWVFIRCHAEVLESRKRIPVIEPVYDN